MKTQFVLFLLFSLSLKPMLGSDKITEPNSNKSILAVGVSNIVNVSCNGACDGSALVTFSGGSGPYSIVWTPGPLTFGSITSSPYICTGLCGGTYTVRVYDGSSTLIGQTANVFIGEPSPLALLIDNSTNVTCNGLSNGTANVSVFGGTSPYTLQWNDPLNQTGFSINSLATGTYTCTITDANGCFGSDILNISNLDNGPIIQIMDSTDIPCFGLNNGVATVAVTGGTLPYASYSWLLPGSLTPNPDQTGTGLWPGYNVYQVIDAAGCVASDGVIINEPAALNLNVTKTDINCNYALPYPPICDGSALATVTGGTAGYQYVWWPYGYTVNNPVSLCAGSHTVVVTDDIGCKDSTTIFINEPPEFSIAVSADSAHCYFNDGATHVVVNGGASPLSIMWSNGVTTNDNIGVPAGPYDVSVTDAIGCQVLSTTFVSSVDGPHVTMDSIPDACGQSLGAASAILTGYNGDPPYTYMWYPTNQTTQSITNVPAGNYTCIVTDNSGCISGYIVTIPNLGAPIITDSSYVATCGNANGMLFLDAANGIPPYQYSVNGSAFSTTQVYSGLIAGTYNIVCRDASNCQAFATHVIQNIGVSLGLNATSPNCNQSNGSIVSFVSGGAGPYTYLWSPGNQTTSNLINVAPGTYTCTVTDNVGCASSTTVTINNQRNVVLDYDYDYYNCGVNSLTATANFGVGGYTFLWTPGNYNTPTVTNIAAGVYTCTVTDASGCIGIGNYHIYYNSNNNTVSGHIYADLNNDCVFNAATETNTLPIQIVATNSTNQYVGWAHVNNQNHTYTLYLPPSAATYTLHLYNGYYYNNQTLTMNCSNNIITLASNCDTLQNIDLGYAPTIGQDLHVSNYCGVARPGFFRTNNIEYFNAGTNTVTATVKMQIDNLLTFSGSTPPPSSITGNLIEWNLGNLAHGQSGSITVNTSVPTIQNGGALGTVLNDAVWIEPITGDTYATDNTSNCTSTIVGSYDPNFKEVFANNMDPFGGIDTTDTEMFYTIHFQNTGTDDAFTVVLKDTISDLLDLNSFEDLGASHHYSVSILPNRLLQVRFDNIMLPDSNSNEPLSHGYFHYKIRTNTDLQFGQQIENTAGIYFDFNPPIITNTVLTPIQENPIGIKNNKTQLNAVVYPNPANGGSFKIQLNDASYKQLHFTLYNVAGAKVMDKQLASQPTNEISTAGLTTGIYFYQLMNADGKKISGKIVISN